MKRKIILVSLGVVVLIGALLAFAAFQASSLSALARPRIEAMLSEALGAPVSVKNISVSVVPACELEVTGVEVKDPQGGESGISIQSLDGRMALLPLLSKRIEVSSLEARSLRVRLVKNASGTTVKGLASSAPRREPPAPSSPTTEETQKTAAPIAVSINSISVTDGSVTLDDQTTKKSITLSDIRLTSSVALNNSDITLPDTNLSLRLQNAHALTLRATNTSIGSSNRKISLEHATVTTPAGSITLVASVGGTDNAGTARIAATGLNAETIIAMASSLGTSLPDYGLRGAVGTDLNVTFLGLSPSSVKGPVTLKDLSINLPDKTQISGIAGTITVNGPFQDLALKTDDLKLAFRNQPLSLASSIQARPSETIIRSLTVKGFGGEIQAPGRVTRGSATTISAKPGIRGISLTALLTALKPDLAKVLTGTITSFDGTLNEMRPEAAAQTAKGNGSLLFQNGSLKGFNLANQALTRVDGLPFVSGDLSKRIPPEFASVFSKPDTDIQELRADFSIASGQVSISSLFARSDLFNLRGRGSLAIAGDMKLDTEIAFSPELSRGIVARVKELTPLLNGEGRLAIPLAIEGRAPALRVVPDIRAIAQKTASKALETTVTDLLKGNRDIKKSLGSLFGRK